MAQFCQNCGTSLADGTAFCPQCGARVQAPAQSIYRQPTQPAASQPQQVGMPPRSFVPQPAPMQKKKKKGKIILPVVAVLLVFSLVFTGLIAPGWMRSKKNDNIVDIFGDDSYVALTLPEHSRSVECALMLTNLSVQAHINAMLLEEAFYRAVENRAPLGQLNAYLHKSEKAWKAADVLSSATYMVGKALYHAGQRSQLSETASLGMPDLSLGNPFVVSAAAVGAPKFDNAKDWAEYINRIYDHGKVGEKTAYVAKILKTDVKRAHKYIASAQEILKGDAALDEGTADGIYKGLMQTKAIGKVAGFTAATIASGGASMGLLSAGGFVASGVDTAIEATNTTLTLTLGEDHAITKSVQETSDKAAPYIAVMSFANTLNPDAWASGADFVGNYRFITDTVVDMEMSNKLLGIEMPQTDANILNILDIPVGKDATPKEKENAVKALTEMGFDKEAVEEALSQEKAPEELPETTIAFDEISDEVLGQKMEETSLSDEQWEALFEEVFNDFLEQMKENDFLEEDDSIWDYDPFMPFEDFPQEGDDEGFDDPANWAKPEVPFEEESTTEVTTQPEEETQEEEEEEETTEPTTEKVTDEESEIDAFMGTWHTTSKVEDVTIKITIILKRSGKTVTVTINDGEESDSYACSYSYQNGVLTLTSSGLTVEATMPDSNHLRMSGEGETITLSR